MEMVEWNVYINGEYIGTVFARSEETARCAALSQFDVSGPSEDAEISVSRR
jgi:hypothetical protein